MDNSETKKYEPFKIPPRDRLPVKEARHEPRQTNTNLFISSQLNKFAEIEIGNAMNSRPSEAVPTPHRVRPVMDEKRAIFSDMRQIARENLSIRPDHAKIFYKQAVFMKDFEDDFAGQAAFSAYFPYYQLMNYEQLRTYFTWRTRVRNGHTANVSVSYAFTYVYELLNNIGVSSPQDGLDRLMAFWRAFREYNQLIDRYLFKWIKDYHVYYELPKSFKDFAYENNIHMHYPGVFAYEPAGADSFTQFCYISKYDIKHSSFYSSDTDKLIASCFDFVADKLRTLFNAADMNFDLFIYQPVNETYWVPFKDAMFYPHLRQTDRRVELSAREIYECRQNKWFCNTTIITDSGRKLTGYILKLMEAGLRRATRFKNKLTVNINMLDGATVKKLDQKGISLEQAINGAVMEFYTAFNRKVISVSVDETVLDKIRQESLDIQEKLIVQDIPDVQERGYQEINNDKADTQASDEWAGFIKALTETEKRALTVIIKSGDIKRFSDAAGIMPEVLIDSINQKAYDAINDNILEFDGNAVVYQEYMEKLTEMVGLNG